MSIRSQAVRRENEEKEPRHDGAVTGQLDAQVGQVVHRDGAARDDGVVGFPQDCLRVARPAEALVPFADAGSMATGEPADGRR